VLCDVLGYRAAEVARMLDSTEASVNSLLRRAREAFESRLPATGRDRAPLPGSRRERETVGLFADAVEAGDTERLVALLTDDAWLTMPPAPFEYQGPLAIGAFLDDRNVRRGAPLRLIATRANNQPAFGCYFRPPNAEIGRPYGLLVLTLDGARVSAMTWFMDTSLFARFGLPRALPDV
jgi:RNA polymerase sigma-70 factor (ECF subfamily)